MIMGRNGQIVTKSARDHDRRPECLNVKFRHNRYKRDLVPRQADRGRCSRCTLAKRWSRANSSDDAKKQAAAPSAKVTDT